MGCYVWCLLSIVFTWLVCHQQGFQLIVRCNIAGGNGHDTLESRSGLQAPTALHDPLEAGAEFGCCIVFACEQIKSDHKATGDFALCAKSKAARATH